MHTLRNRQATANESETDGAAKVHRGQLRAAPRWNHPPVEPKPPAAADQFPASRRCFGRLENKARTRPVITLAISGNALAETLCVHYSLRGSGRNVTVQAESSAEARQDRHGYVPRCCRHRSTQGQMIWNKNTHKMNY
jgi:hypothetical protein